MLTISHIFAGILMFSILTGAFPSYFPPTATFLLLSIIFANIPDFSALWNKLNRHRKSLEHYPFFWAAISFSGFLIADTFGYNTSIFMLLFIQVMFHFLLDFIGGRTSGVYFFYPFSEKEYSISELRPEYSNFKVLNLELDKIERYFKNYSRYKTLVLFEFSICLLGLLSLIMI